MFFLGAFTWNHPKVLIYLTFLVISDSLIVGSITRRILELSLGDWCLREREVFPEVEDKD